MDPIRNFAVGTVATAPNPATTGTSFVINAGAGGLFPDPAADGAFNIVIHPNNAVPDHTNSEIVRVTARTTNTFTITREQEDTNARSVQVGDVVILAPTRRSLETLGGTGWTPAYETWTYASATTITVPTGAASRYQKGMPFKLTANSVVLQGYIIGVADTVLTVVGDALTNHTFTNNFYGQSGTVPLGFQEWFDYTPTYSASSAMTYTSVTTNVSRFRISGQQCLGVIVTNGTTGGTAHLRIFFTTPVNIASAAAGQNFGVGTNQGVDSAAFFNIISYEANTNNLIAAWKPDSSNYGLGTGRRIRANYSFPY